MVVCKITGRAINVISDIFENSANPRNSHKGMIKALKRYDSVL